MANLLVNTQGIGNLARNSQNKTKKKVLGRNTKTASRNKGQNRQNTRNTSGNVKPKITQKKVKGTPKNNFRKNKSLIGKMPQINNSITDIKISKNELRKLLKSMFADMGLSEKEIVDMIIKIGKDDNSIKKLTKLINKSRESDTSRKALIIKNMNTLKDLILKMYQQFDDLNNNLGILFERK